MRALFVHGDAAWDGGARIFASVARALAERGHQTWFAAPTGSEASVEAAGREANVIELPARRSARGDAREMRTQLPRDFVDVVFVHEEREQLAAALAVRGAGRGGVVRRIAAGGRLARSWRGRRAERLVPTRLLYTSEDPPAGHAAPSGALTPMRAELGVEEGRPASAAAPAAEAGDLGDTPVLACIATRDSLRRATNVVRTAALLAQRHAGLRLRVIGSVAHDEELRLLAAALGIARRAEWLGHPRHLPDALDGVAAGWVIADGDEAALGALDLMAHGVAVLAERTSIAARYVSHGIQGTLMATLDPPMMAAETAILLADRERRLAMGAAGRARVEREYPFHDMLAAFEHAMRSARERAMTRA